MLFFLCLRRFPSPALGQQHLKMKHFVHIVCVFVCSRPLWWGHCLKWHQISPAATDALLPLTPPPHRSSISALLCERFWTFWTFFKRPSLRGQQKESEVDVRLTRNHATKFHSAINLRFTTLRVMIYSRLTFDPRWKAKFDWNGTLGNSRILWPLSANVYSTKPVTPGTESHATEARFTIFTRNV